MVLDSWTKPPQRSGSDGLREGKRALFVETSDILERLGAALEGEGFRVDLAESGRDAIRRIREQGYSLVVFDSRLSDMDCRDLLVEMSEAAPRAIKIAVTTHPRLKRIIDLLNLGVDAYITPPIRPSEVHRVIKGKMKDQGDGELNEEKMLQIIRRRIHAIRQKKRMNET